MMDKKENHYYARAGKQGAISGIHIKAKTFPMCLKILSKIIRDDVPYVVIEKTDLKWGECFVMASINKEEQ